MANRDVVYTCTVETKIKVKFIQIENSWKINSNAKNDIRHFYIASSIIIIIVIHMLDGIFHDGGKNTIPLNSTKENELSRTASKLFKSISPRFPMRYSGL